MTPSNDSHPNGNCADNAAADGNERVHPRSILIIAAALLATLLLAACGQVDPVPEPEPAGIILQDTSVTVPFAFGPGRQAPVQLARTGGYDGEVTVTIDASALPAGVTLSATTLTFAPGETAASVTLTSDETVAAADLNVPVQLTMTATAEDPADAATPSAEDLSDTATLSVEVAALVMNTENDGEGSLRHLDATLPDGSAGDLVLVSFDPTVFSSPTTIELESDIDIHHGRHFEGPVNGDGEPIVTIRGSDAGTGIIGVKDSIVGKFSNLIFENGRGNTNGGAIHNAGLLEIENSVVRNSEGVRGGGVYNQVGAELTLRGTHIASNTADFGGGIYNNGGKVSAFDSVVDANVAGSAGGGVYNAGATVSGMLHRGDLFLSGTQISANVAMYGGGVSNTYEGDLTFVRGVISGNEAKGAGLSDGGGIDNDGVAIVTFSEISGNKAAFGGGMNNPAGSELRIGSSTVSANVATVNGGGLFSNGVVAITNSTFANNEALRGAGLYVSSNAVSTAVVAFSTIAGNTAGEDGGGIDYSGELTLRGTLIADNDIGTGVGPDLYWRGSGDFISLGYNLIGNGASSGAFGPDNLVGEDPVLGPLQDNGGDTPTMALLAGSPAIDRVPPSDCLDVSSTPLEQDQRGESRPSASNCDIGAFEVQ